MCGILFLSIWKDTFKLLLSLIHLCPGVLGWVGLYSVSITMNVIHATNAADTLYNNNVYNWPVDEESQQQQITWIQASNVLTGKTKVGANINDFEINGFYDRNQWFL